MIRKYVTENKKYILAYISIALLSFVFLVCQSDEGSLWYDEMHTLGFLRSTSVPNSSYITLRIMKVFVNHVPYGIEWIYLLSELAFAGTIVLIGLTGNLLKNGRTGLYACAVAAFSSYLYQQVALEFRQYFMLFFMTSLIFFLITLRDRIDIGKKWLFIIVYGLCNMMIMDCHEYGKVVAGGVIVFDLFLLYIKKVNKRHLLSFVFPGVYAVYWLIKNAVGGLVNNYSWPPNPTPDLVFETFLQLLNQSNVSILLLIVGVVYALLYIFQKKDDCESKIGYLFAGYMIVLVFSASIIYSNFVNPENSLYVNRYFISVITYIIMFVAIGCDFLVQIVIENKKNDVQKVVVSSVVFALMIFGWQGWENIPEEHIHPYVQAAEYLRNDENVYKETSLVYIPDNGYVVNAWSYFFTEDGKLESANVVGKYQLEMENMNFQKIYVIAPAFSPIEEHQQFLDDNYEMTASVDEYSLKIYEKR